ncbi:MAG: SRPBCC domain-containing protein [Actinomycetota bacterium]|nr:SRPBCC domain-containing protein [Actinomycetota bacterium]
MPVRDTQHDLDALTITFTADFAAPLGRVWEVYTDPRLVEKWFGPPTYPATFVDHDLRIGGRVTYFMTGPEGHKHGGWWEFTAVEPQTLLAFDDGFADDDLQPVASMPVSHNEYRFAEAGGTTTVVTVSTYESAEGLQKVLDMGVIEGATAAINQIDALLAI